MDNAKKPWMSKTILFNALVAIAAFFPQVSEMVKANAEAVLMTIGVIGMVLRTITKGKVTIE